MLCAVFWLSDHLFYFFFMVRCSPYFIFSQLLFFLLLLLLFFFYFVFFSTGPWTFHIAIRLNSILSNWVIDCILRERNNNIEYLATCSRQTVWNWTTVFFSFHTLKDLLGKKQLGFVLMIMMLVRATNSPIKRLSI